MKICLTIDEEENKKIFPTEIDVVDSQFAKNNFKEKTGCEKYRRKTPITKKFFAWNRIRNNKCDKPKIWKF